MSGDRSITAMDLETDENEGWSERKHIRVWIDGCFDMVHPGHIISIIKSKQLGDHLSVGLLNDEYIIQHKGYPVFTEEERYTLVSAIRWVDEVVVGLTHGTDLDTLDKYDMDFCVHGDDVTLNEDGIDPHHDIKKVGKYRCYKRVPGISTTGVIDRLLTRVPECKDKNKNSKDNEICQYTSPETSGLILGLDLLIQLYRDSKPRPGDRVVYVDGAFDLFHTGHLDFLRQAKAEGDFVIVGLHSDDIVKDRKGNPYPIMTVQERMINCVACKYVSHVIIGAPYIISVELMDYLQIDVVCHGTFGIGDMTADLSRRYEVPKLQGKFKLIESQNDVTTTSIVNRILSNRVHYENRNLKKRSKE